MSASNGVRVQVEFMGGPADGLVREYDVPSLAATMTMWYPTKLPKGTRYGRYVLPSLSRGAMVPGFRLRAQYDRSVVAR